MKKIRILFYIKDPNGGTGRFIEQIYQPLSQDQRFEVQVITHTESYPYSFPYSKVGFFIPKQQGISIGNLIKSVVNVVFVFIYISRFSPNIVYSLDIFANIVGDIISFFLKFKLINSSHVNIERHIQNQRKTLFSTFVKFLVRYMYSRADIHIVPSKGLKKQLTSKFNIKDWKIRWIPYLFDINAIKRYRKSHNSLDKKNIKLVTIVRNDSQKDVLGLARVVEYLRGKGLDVEMNFLGIDAISQEIKDSYSNEFVKKYLHFPGWKKNPFVELVSADIFILLSHFEGFSYAILEVQAIGKPIIASDVDYGPRELIRHKENGILISSHNPEVISTYILEIMEDPKLYASLSINAKKNADKYSTELLYPKYLNLFFSLVNSPKRP